MKRLPIILVLLLIYTTCTALNYQEMQIITAAGLEKSDGIYIRKMVNGKIASLPITTAMQAISVEVDFENTSWVRQSLNLYFKSKGWRVFLIQQYYDYNGQKNLLGILRTQDQYEIVRLQKTAIRKRSTAEIIAQLKTWEAAFRLEISGAESYWVTAEFLDDPPDWERFAGELTAFCPELLNDGTGKISDMIADMQKTHSFTISY